MSAIHSGHSWGSLDCGHQLDKLMSEDARNSLTALVAVTLFVVALCLVLSLLRNVELPRVWGLAFFGIASFSLIRLVRWWCDRRKRE